MSLQVGSAQAGCLTSQVWIIRLYSAWHLAALQLWWILLLPTSHHTHFHSAPGRSAPVPMRTERNFTLISSPHDSFGKSSWHLVGYVSSSWFLTDGTFWCYLDLWDPSKCFISAFRCFHWKRKYWYTRTETLFRWTENECNKRNK